LPVEFLALFTSIVSLRLIDQYEYFKTNWISRGVPTVEMIDVKLLGLSTSGKEGVAKLG
jgi:hypothetical protein